MAGLCYTSTQANGDYTLGYNWNNESGAYSWNSGLAAPSGRWSLAVLSVSPTYATIYVVNTNGITLATHTYAHVVQNFDGVTLIGEDGLDGGSGSRTFNGSIDEVEIFNRTLTQNQVMALFTAAFAPVASFTAAPVSGWAPLTVNFTDYSAGSITNRHWIFGDGSTLDATATSVAHIYAGSGNYTATLIVSGPSGTGTNSSSIIANLAATPQITSATVAQNNLILVGLGTPTASYGLLSSTNLWTLTNGLPLASGAFDAITGTCTNQVLISATNPAVFFRLKSPYP